MAEPPEPDAESNADATASPSADADADTDADTDLAPDNWKEWTAALGTVALAASMVAVLVWVPKVFDTLRVAVLRTLTAPVAVDSAPGTLSVHREDVVYMNRIYTELNHEVGYCGLTAGTVVTPWLADTRSAGREFVNASVANCPVAPGEEVGFIHTHPSGVEGLSDADVRALLEDGFAFMCVQTGRIEAGPDTRTRALQCYRATGTAANPTLTEIPVFVVEADSGDSNRGRSSLDAREAARETE